MHIQTLTDSPKNERGNGQLSYLLMQKGQWGSANMSVTWIEGEPGSEQPSHTHATNEQVYIVVRGRGRMTVGDEQQEVGAGTLVFVPPGSPHSILNVGEEPLLLITATSPPFGSADLDPVFAFKR